MASKCGWRIFLGPLLLLIVSYVIYQLRFPLWYSLRYVESIFAMLTISYFAVFVLALVLLKKDSKKPLSGIFKTSGNSIVLVGMVFAVLYLGIWYAISFAIGDRFQFTSFPSLSGYENYSVYFLPLAFSLQLIFVVFGAFAEEVAYRGYVQTRISSECGFIVGLSIASLLFSLQHIDFFQLGWIETFFQTMFVHVLLFGIFVGYLFFKSKENIWSVFSFHALSNILSVSLPIAVTASLPFASQLADIPSFAIIILLVHYLL
jgi:membrane protease YdiL (CAAX protease family)